MIAFVLLMLTMGIISSAWLGTLMEHSFVGPVNFNAFPLVLTGLLLLLFVFMMRHEQSALLQLRWPAWSQCIGALLSFFVVCLFAYVLTHPSLPRFIASHAFIQAHPVAGGPLIAAELYAALLLPIVPLLFLVLPFSLLRRFAGTILFGLLLIVAFLLGNAAEAIFHQYTAPAVLRMASAMLSALPGTMVVQPERWELSFRGFSVILGPVCSGFSMLVLFVGLFCYLWRRMAVQDLLSRSRAVVALMLGIALLWMLNVVRVALIMIVGSYSYALGTALFHGAAGAVFFFLVFLLYVRGILPFLRNNRR